MEEDNGRLREILDDMYDFEEEFDQEEKEDGKYFIGIYICMKDSQMWNSSACIVEDSKKIYLGMAISASLFFRYEYKYVQRYLCSAIQYCPYAIHFHLKVSIMQLNITDNGSYLVTVKTYWLKLIQRHWKNIMKKRKEIINKMNKYNYLQLREISKHKKYNIPILKGMLSYYSNN